MQETDYQQYTDLISERLGGKVLYATDDFFAEKENLIKAGRGIFIPDKYTEQGKWMDGWESRRKRDPGHDICIVQLATPGRVHGFDIDTNHFLGNHPPHAAIEGLYWDKESSVEALLQATAWQALLPKLPLAPGSQNLYACSNQQVVTHLKLHIYPDGGVARLRAYGEVVKDWASVDFTQPVDMAAAINGAKALASSDMFFSDMNNLLMPGKGVNMGDGWETKRSRVPGHVDWVIIRLAKKAHIDSIHVDTHHFKGNFPEGCSLEGTACSSDEAALSEEAKWQPLLPKKLLSAHQEHIFDGGTIESHPEITHVRFTIYPDGGISRLRLWGK